MSNRPYGPPEVIAVLAGPDHRRHVCDAKLYRELDNASELRRLDRLLETAGIYVHSTDSSSWLSHQGHYVHPGSAIISARYMLG